MDPMKPGQFDGAPSGAHIGKSVIIKGELSGSENLYVDGEVEGIIHLEGHNLTIGQNGRVRADVKAKDVVVQGRVDGNVSAGDSLDLRNSAVVVGDLKARRIAVEDGASVKGKIETTNPEPRSEASMQSAAAGIPVTAGVPISSTPVLEPKR